MKRFIAIIFAAGLIFAQEPTAKITAGDPKAIDGFKPADKDAQIAALTKERDYLKQQNQLLQQKLDALMRYYAVDDALRQLEAQKPK